MSPNRPKADIGGIFYSILLKIKPQIGRRPKKEDFLFHFVEKWVRNRPKAEIKGFYILYLILL